MQVRESQQTRVNITAPTHHCTELPSVCLIWFCTSEVRRLELCFLPSAGFPHAYLQQCLANCVAAVCALDLHLKKPCNLTAFHISPVSSLRFSRNTSYSFW